MNSICLKSFVAAYDRNIATERLGNEKTIKRIAMMKRKVSNSESFMQFDRKKLNRVFLNLLEEKFLKWDLEIELSNAVFDSDFPSGNKT